MEGTKRKREYRYAAILVPACYFLKRFILCVSLVFLQDFFWGQIALQMAFTTFMLFFLQWVRPLESKFDRLMESFNEFMTLTVLYLLMYFSDFNPDPDFKNSLGFVYIADVVIFTAVHLGFMMVETFRKAVLFFKRIYNRNCRSKPRVRTEPVTKNQMMQLHSQERQGQLSVHSNSSVSEASQSEEASLSRSGPSQGADDSN